MPRIARIYIIDYPHHITQRGNNKGTVFLDDEDRKFYLKTLSIYSRIWSIDIWAYCLMPNHIHILAVPKKEESLAKGIGTTNLVYTQYINRKYNRAGRLWQNRFFSAIIEKESYLWATLRYIEKNPVRANLVEKAEDYRWSSAKSHVLGIRDNVLSGICCLDKKEMDLYSKFLKSESKEFESQIRSATSKGRPLGSIEFVKEMEKFVGRNIIPKKAGRHKKLV